MGNQGNKSRKKVSWILYPLSWGKSKNLRIFLFCFLMACVFWGLNSLNKDYQTGINMPMQVIYNDSLLIPLDPPPNKVPLKVVGYGWDLIKWNFGWKIEPILLEPSGLPEANLLSFADFSEEINAKLNDIRLLNFIHPDAPLNFDFLEHKKVPVGFDSLKIPFEEGYYLKRGVKISPDSLLFSGPKSLLGHLKDHYELVLQVERIDANFISSISVQYPHSELVSVYPKEINIIFSVGKWEIVERTIPIELRTKKPSKRLILGVNATEVKLVFKLPEGGIAGPEFDSVLAYVDLDKIKAADSLVVVKIEKIPVKATKTLIIPDTLQIIRRNESS